MGKDKSNLPKSWNLKEMAEKVSVARNPSSMKELVTNTENL